MRTKLIILSIIAMALVVMAFPTNKFQPKNSMGTLLQIYIAHTSITGNRGNIHYLPTDTERKAIHQI